MTASRLRLAIILVGILVAGLVLLTWTQPWFELELSTGKTLSVLGQSAAPALSALGLASLALMGALSIAGPGIRLALGVVEAAIGVALVVVTVGAIADPAGAAASTITAATAVSGPESIAALISSSAMSAFPPLAVAAGVLTVLVGLAVVLTGRRWPGATRKYEVAPDTDSGTPVGAWDSLSDGSDPTR